PRPAGPRVAQTAAGPPQPGGAGRAEPPAGQGPAARVRARGPSLFCDLVVVTITVPRSSFRGERLFRRSTMIRTRPGHERGRTALDWLDSRHSFSFGDYYDPAQLGFRSLRVLNDDRVAPGTGFGMHPHRDMEILTWVLSGALEHADSLGNGSVIRP